MKGYEIQHSLVVRARGYTPKGLWFESYLQQIAKGVNDNVGLAWWLEGMAREIGDWEGAGFESSQ